MLLIHRQRSGRNPVSRKHRRRRSRLARFLASHNHRKIRPPTRLQPRRSSRKPKPRRNQKPRNITHHVYRFPQSNPEYCHPERSEGSAVALRFHQNQSRGAPSLTSPIRQGRDTTKSSNSFATLKGIGFDLKGTGFSPYIQSPTHRGFSP